MGMAGGLAIGASVVGYRTDVASLTAMGAVSGLGVGLAQAAAMQRDGWRRPLWAVATPALWALGWLVTSQVIVDAERQHANFGSSGALVVTLLGGLVLAARTEDQHGAHPLPLVPVP